MTAWIRAGFVACLTVVALEALPVSHAGDTLSPTIDPATTIDSSMADPTVASTGAATASVVAGGTATVVPTAPLPAPPTAEDIAMGVAVLTEPDAGPRGLTHRWSGPSVTYRIDLPVWPEGLRRELDEAVAFVETATGVDWVLVHGDADIVIVAKDDNGGRVTAGIGADGHITHARIELGCCRARVVWEEILQVTGAFGDRADSRSLFSQEDAKVRGDGWETWLLTALYDLPPGSDAAAVARRLATPPRP